MLALRAHEKGLELACRRARRMCRTHSSAIPAACARSLVNLVGNAIKFTERGEIVVRGRTSGDGTGGRCSRCTSVRDTGIGDPARPAAAIFEAFTQADGSTTRQLRRHRPRAGDLRRSWCELMGGASGSRASRGRGALHFHHELRSRQGRNGHWPDSPALRTLKAFPSSIVDDNADQPLTSSWRCCTDLGMRSECGGRPREALPHLMQLAPTATSSMVLDVQMPGMSGTACARARAAALAGRSRVLFLSSASSGPAATSQTRFGPRQTGERFRTASIAIVAALQAVADRPHVDGSGKQEDHLRSRRAPWSRRPLRILLAEDNPVNQELVVGILASVRPHRDGGLKRAGGCRSLRAKEL